jgi:hypothetical protein
LLIRLLMQKYTYIAINFVLTKLKTRVKNMAIIFREDVFLLKAKKKTETTNVSNFR